MQKISVRFNGGMADHHLMDMRVLGQSMIGVERILQYGLIWRLENRVLQPRQRTPFLVQTPPPTKGSYEYESIATLAATTIPVLPIFYEYFQSWGADFLYDWIKCVLFYRGGRMKDYEEVFAKIMKDMLDDRQNERNAHMASQELLADTLLQTIKLLSGHAKDAIAPIGSASRSVTLQNSGRSDSATIDYPMAQAIRSNQELEVGDMQKITFKVDGITRHNMRLKVEDPENNTRFVTAEIRDPSFENDLRFFTNALNTQQSITANAKIAKKADGKIHCIYIMNIENEPKKSD